MPIPIIAAVIVAVGGVISTAIGTKSIKDGYAAKEHLILTAGGVIAAIIGGLILIFGSFKAVTQLFMKPSYDVTTSIYYSAGSTSDWSYGNQRKEFSADEDCYLRVGTLINSSNRRGKNKNVDITVTFIGTDICNISQYDGARAKSIRKEDNTQTFTFKTKTKRNATEEDLIIFKYEPTSTGTVTVKIEYDDRIDSIEDVMNTIIFK